MGMRECGKAKCARILCERVSEVKAGEKEEEETFPSIDGVCGVINGVGAGGGERRNGITTEGENWVDFFVCGVVGNTMVGAAPRNGFIPDLIPSNKLFPSSLSHRPTGI